MRGRTGTLSVVLAHGAVALSFAAFAQNDAQQASRDRPSCLAPGAWHSLDGGGPRPTPSAELLAFASRRDIVLLGERHDERDHHAWQLQTLAALHALRPQMVIGFESFPRRVQGTLDKWVAGELTESEFLERSDWDKVWSFPSGLYMPLFQFARINRIPMVALNVDRELTQQITQKGWDGVPAERKEGVSRPAPPSQAYRDVLFEIYKEHPQAKEKSGDIRKTDPDFLRFIDSQTTWDRAMAEALARRVTDASGTARPMVVGIMGAGHVSNGYGVPHQLRDLGVSSVATLVPVDAAGGCKKLATGFADAVFALPAMAQEAPRKPRLGISLQRTDNGIEVLEVVGGSLAESTGLRKGDLIVSLAGTAVAQTGAVIAAVRSQPAGTWLPMTVRREGKTLDLIVKFPPPS
jgi:uncharacterized iron-regulated protein